jgi:Ca2+-binding EF-hand superfamily protein
MMKIYTPKMVLLVSLAMLSIPIISFASDASRNQEIADRFAKCDTNHDGKLTLNEAKGCMPRIYDHFSDIDSSNKGYVTVAEIQAIAGR